MHLPQLIGPMKHYLWILKVTHGGADLDSTLEMAKGSLDGDLQCALMPLMLSCVNANINKLHRFIRYT